MTKWSESSRALWGRFALKIQDDMSHVLSDKMNCTVGFVSCLCEFNVAWAAWHKAAGLVHQQNSLQFPNLTVQFILSLSIHNMTFKADAILGVTRRLKEMLLIL